MKFRLGKYIITLGFRITRLEAEVLGIRSNLDSKSVYDGGKHVLMLDCDEIADEILIRSIVELQHRYRLGDAEIYTSSMKTVYQVGFNGAFPFIHAKEKKITKRHVYFFQDIMDYWRAVEIIHFATNVLKIVDPAYSRWRGIRANMVLRESPKSNGFVPQFDFIVESPFKKTEIKWFKESVVQMLDAEKTKLEVKK